MTVKPVTPADATDLIRANVESRQHHAPWVQAFTDAAGFAEWIAQPASVCLVARDQATSGVAGVLTLSQISRKGFQNAYVGFYGSAAFARRGLMTEAVRRATRYAFEELGLHRLEANIQAGNTRSIALVRRVGFQHEGFSPRYLMIDGAWRDHERWALLADA